MSNRIRSLISRDLLLHVLYGSFLTNMMSLSAFDMVHDPSVAVETLVSLGFERILTSGCDSSALEGLPAVKRLVEQVSEAGYLLRKRPQG